MSKYGLPYKGSKNKLAEDICALFPKRENFYDLFSGGGSLTHCALIQNKFNNYYMNDINPRVIEFFINSVNGKYKNETKWISREEFFEKKDSDPFIKYCWSFGNKGDTYLYGSDVEELKRSWHSALVFNEFESAQDLLGIDFSPIQKEKDQYSRYLLSKEILYRKMENNSESEFFSVWKKIERGLQNYEALNRTRKLELLKNNSNLNRLNYSVKSYDQIEIKNNSIIYCDIPYENTDGYNDQTFDFESFYSWCKKQKELIFISSYEISDPDFICINEFKHRSILGIGINFEVTERVFIPKHQLSLYKENQVQPTLFDELLY